MKGPVIMTREVLACLAILTLAGATAAGVERQSTVDMGPTFYGLPADWPLGDYRHAPAEAVERWKDWKFGIRIHWGYYSMIGGWCGQTVNCIPGWDGYPTTYHTGHCDDRPRAWSAFYSTLYQYFNPVQFNADEWMDLFARSGIRYFTFTAKHIDGFCMWPTTVKRRVKCQVEGMGRFGESEISYSIADTPYGKDVVGQLVAAARRRQMGIGLYYNHCDWTDPAYAWDKFNMHFDPQFTKQSDPARWRKFIEQERRQLQELTTRYGPLDVLSFDCKWPKDAWNEMADVARMVRRNQPNVMMRNRGIGPFGDYDTPERWVPKDSSDKRIGNPNWQVIYTGCKYWSYRANDEYKPKEWIVETLIDVCAKGGNFQVGFGPTGLGTWPKEVVQRLEYAGDWLKVNGEAIYATRPWSHWNDGPSVRYTRSKDHQYVYAIALGWPGTALRLTHVVPRPGTEVRLLGFAPPLHWERVDQGLRIDLPATLQDEARRPCKQAYAFRLEGDAASPVIGPPRP
jgi:alpha-L-fucosidase